MPARNTMINTNEIINLYRQGVVGSEIAKRLGVSKGTVYNRLHESGEYVKTPKEATTDNAHQRHLKRAQTVSLKHNYVGKYEDEIFNKLKALGYKVNTQVAIDKYIIDGMIGNTIVEVWNKKCSPRLEYRNGPKIDYLVSCGYNVIYVWIGEAGMELDRVVTSVAHYLSRPNYSDALILRGDGRVHV